MTPESRKLIKEARKVMRAFDESAEEVKRLFNL